LPGDISSQISLGVYAKPTFNILGHLLPQVAMQVLEYLTIAELLDIGTVSREWSMMVRHPARYHCLAMTATDPVLLQLPTKPEDWCIHLEGESVEAS
jgi:pyrimidine and pyridine-specific 5'-nucleotidase